MWDSIRNFTILADKMSESQCELLELLALAKCLAVNTENCSEFALILLSFAAQTQPTSLYAFSPWAVTIKERTH